MSRSKLDSNPKPSPQLQALAPRFLILWILLALIAFAGNSLLARAALSLNESGTGIGPLSFTAIRLVSGALLLALYVRSSHIWHCFNVRQAGALLVYALMFSIAYVNLPAGTGALILFLSVQITMLTGGFLAGERLNTLQKIGVFLALSGIVVLFGPSVSVPPVLPAILMVFSGMGWGVYSLLGRSITQPIVQSASNFFYASLAGLIFFVPGIWVNAEPFPNPTAVGLAIISGAVTSGLGYVIWFRVLPHIRSTTAAVSQLSVPVIAAFGGVIWLSEPVTWSFGLATLFILGGLALTISRKKKTNAP